MIDQSRMVVIGCAHSAGVAVEDGQYPLPAYVEWVEVPCGAAVDELILLRAFESGAGRVLVLVCNEQACRSLDGQRWAELRTEAARALLQEAGLEGWRLQLQHIGPNMPADLLGWIESFEEPLPSTEEQANT